MIIFKGNPRASKLRTTYVDAFAGTGYRNLPTSRTRQLGFFRDEDAESFLKGSAWVTLENDPPFDKYVFVELNAEHAAELENLKIQFPNRADKVEIKREEANRFLKEWCERSDWQFNHAVVFLDPYGMEVEWPTLQTIARTGAIDLWLLFPLGQAVNRLLPKNRLPDEATANRLNRIFGTDEWKDAFYRERQSKTLFGIKEEVRKEADFAAIGKFFVERLKTIFVGVADNPLSLRNSKNVPIFLLCFAASNPKGAPTALKIAQHLLRMKTWSRRQR